MDRNELIKEEGNKLMRPVLCHSMSAALERYQRERAVVLRSFGGVLEMLCHAAEKQQGNGEKGPLVYLGICYCLSSAYTGIYELRLDLYDEEFYLDESMCYAYWEPEFITSYLVRDLAYFKNEIRKSIPRIKTEEARQYMVGYMRNYMYLTLEFLRQELSWVMGEIHRGGAELSEEFKVIFGEYMGNYTVVCGSSKERREA